MAVTSHTDCLVVGGGIIGLSIAYELACHGVSVRLLERGQTGREASWAGAGILPPGSWFSDHPALERLATASFPLHAEWSARLREETGIDDEFSECGALYAITSGSESRLRRKFASWSSQGIECKLVSANEARTIEPCWSAGDAYFVPSESQVRNPRRLAALRIACQERGVVIETNAEVIRFTNQAGRVIAAETATRSFGADSFCLAAGAWTGPVASLLSLRMPTAPVRGQMLLLRLPKQTLHSVIHSDGRYIVPRQDGRILVGATVENVGYDKATNAADIDALQKFAVDLVPTLQQAEVETAWAGLRPGNDDDLPIIGRAPRHENVWLATGHYRSGLQFAPATAIAVRQSITGDLPAFDLSPFSPERFAVEQRVQPRPVERSA
ncbi:MAG: glycine oxidase ThiO [Planctomycetota bacterium]